MLKVGYIGLGIMGKSIARNIMKAGFPVAVNNRSRASVDELVAEGAKAGDVAGGSDRADRRGLHQPARHPGCGERCPR